MTEPALSPARRLTSRQPCHAWLRLLEFLLPAEHTVSECVQQIGLSQGRARPTWRVADLIMLARSLAADNAAALADCVRIAPATSAEPAARS